MGVIVDCALAGSDQLGECPLWDERDQSLWWVDIRAPALRHWKPGAPAAASLLLPQAVGSIALRLRGGLVAAAKAGMLLFRRCGPGHPVYHLGAPAPDARATGGPSAGGQPVRGAAWRHGFAGVALRRLNPA